MARYGITFTEAVAKADALLTLGEETVYLSDEDAPDVPWSLASDVEAGGSYRLTGPASAAFFAKHASGLTFKWSVDFEQRDANGRGVHLFDRDRLRDLMRKLPAPTRAKFAAFLETEVLPGIKKHTAEIRDALNKQQDSEDCVVGLIQFAA